MLLPSYLLKIPTALVISLAAFSAGTVRAAISVGQFGINNANAVIDFSSLPTASEWSTGSISGNHNAITTQASMITSVAAQTAGTFNTALPAAANYNAATTFKHHTTDQVLASTAGSSVGATVMLATMSNTHSQPVVAFDAVYDFGIVAAGSEEVPGFNMFYSLTGLANSWVFVAQHQAAGQQVASIVPAGGWAPSSTLYLLWADDNSQNTEAQYSFDNFTVQNVAVPEPGRAGLLLASLSALIFRRQRLQCREA